MFVYFEDPYTNVAWFVTKWEALNFPDAQVYYEMVKNNVLTC